MNNEKVNIEDLFENNCKKCRYYCEEEGTCNYGVWDKPIDEAIEIYLKDNVCTFEGDFRFETTENEVKENE